MNLIKSFKLCKNLIITIISLLSLQTLYAQQMSGDYTIGGNGPDFNTFQEAANALVGNGVSGPVIFSIRPGIYFEQNATAPVMLLEQAVAGVSETNTITFKPDESQGGNVNNVILEINGGTPPAGGRTVVGINVEYTNISNLTMRDVDTSGSFANSLLRLRGRSGQGIIRGIKIIGCRLLGSPVFNEIPSFSSGSRGTINAIWLDKTNLTDFADIELNENYIEKTNYGIFFNAGLSFTDVTIKSNIIIALHNKVDGNGNHGSGIHFDRINDASNLNILNNTIDFAEGGGASLSGITLLSTSSTTQIQAIIDGNYILNRPGKLSTGTFQTNAFAAINVSTSLSNFNHDIVISNNMIAGNKIRQPGGAIGTRKGIGVSSNNIKVFHNTIVNPFEILSAGSNEFSRAVEIKGSNVKVINDIIVDYGKNSSGSTNAVAYGIYDTTGLVSDHNIFDITSGQALAFVGGTGSSSNFVYNLSSLQEKTHADSNSIVKQLEFNDSSDVHLTECQMQDPDLVGIPIPGITLDIDGDQRSATVPTRGADEAVLNNFRYWSDTFHADLPGYSFSIAADKFDNLIGDNIAVPDFDNNQVLTYHSVGRSFVVSNTLSTPFKPIAVLFHDFDNDGKLDLIVGGSDPGGIKVFWGDGAGGFPQTTEITTDDPVLNIVPGFNILGISPLHVPMGQFYGYLLYGGNREICFALQLNNQYNIDTLNTFMHSIATGDFDGDNKFEVAGVDHTSGDFVIMKNFDQAFVTNVPCNQGIFSSDEETNFETGWYSYANSIIKGDFDGDGDLDFITTGISQYFIVYIKNEGNLNFSYQLIPVDDFAQALAALDYDNDGDLDFVTANYSQRNGITLFLNDGSGNFSPAVSCFQDLIEGFPEGIVAKDFDVDGRTDIAVTTSFNKLAVLYNVGGPTSVEQQQNNLFPEEYILEQNYPNPFNPTTTIEFSIPQAGLVQVSIYNILGEEVKQLINEERPAGNHSVQFNASQLASGIYFYRLQAGLFVETKKMILMK
jgi:hypothetical protein